MCPSIFKALLESNIPHEQTPLTVKDGEIYSIRDTPIDQMLLACPSLQSTITLKAVS